MKPADHKAKAKRMALNALRRARRAAERAGITLSDWEGEFLGSVEGRVEKYGRAFADPEKGAMGASLSLRQGIKLKEIASKAKGKAANRPGRARKSGFSPAKGKSGLKRRSGFGKPGGKMRGG